MNDEFGMVAEGLPGAWTENEDKLTGSDFWKFVIFGVVIETIFGVISDISGSGSAFDEIGN